MTGSGSNRIQRDLRRFHLTGRHIGTNPVSVSAFVIKREPFLPGLAFLGLILCNSLWFAKPADRVELAPSFFEAIQEQLGLKLCQPRLP
jgi:hypothetical protein